ncbi:MAG: PD-(D/E)XK nuclease family protein [Alphaproteobacteria bacterium]|nr:PD-(D/E)XK nuclease family protein [Alphaproteobacteria bacterium]
MSKEKIYNISADEPFVDVLAQRYLKEFADRPDDLANVLFLMPNRRACQSLIDAFVRQHDLKPTILPQIRPIAEVDEDEVFLTHDISVLKDLPPAVDSTDKILQLTRLIMKKSELDLDKISLAQAYALAQNLSQLMDLTYNVKYKQKIDLSSFKNLVGEEYALHWKKTLLLLQIIMEYWPKILAENDKADTVCRRNALLESEMNLWRQSQTTQRIVVAGTTAAFPIMKELVKTVMDLPNGEVYLYGLDKYLDDSDWAKVEENHPQFELKELLQELGISRDSVTTVGNKEISPREKIVAEIMRPAETSDKWRNLTAHPLPESDFKDIHLLNCDDLRQEAQAIALIIRETLNEPEKTVALVTMDRNLSRRVVSELHKWDINADDSAGRPLALTQIGIYLRLVWEAVENGSQTATIALMKHPFTACGMRRDKLVRWATLLETFWRNDRKLKKYVQNFYNKFKAILKPLEDIYAQPQADLQQILETHIKVAEKLADTDAKFGSQLIWRDDDGAVAAKWVSDFMPKSASFGNIKLNDYGGFFTALLMEQSVRKRYGTHPRVKILGPIEARLTQYDVTIIGEANEGIWPNQPQADMWMSRPMKLDFELPLPERQIGVAAADFAHLMNAPRVYVTRAKKVGGNPVNKSRWWLRFETVLTANFGDKKETYAFIYQKPYAYWAKNLDRRDEYNPISAPEPRPALERRPREMSATNIEKWRYNPYTIYAKYILSLYPLDDLDTPKQSYDFGNIVHNVLKKFNDEYNSDFYPDADEARTILLELGNDEFDKNKVPEDTRIFWQSRFESIVEWIINKELSYRPSVSEVKNEINGSMTMQGPLGDFKITAKADRVDILKNGCLNILDYKTGKDKSANDMVEGKAPQLPIEALIAQKGGFPGVAGAPIESLQYWAFQDKFNATDAEQSAEAMKNIQTIVQKLINAYDDISWAYLVKPKPSNVKDYSDYDHLSRIGEWGTHYDSGNNFGGE